MYMLSLTVSCNPYRPSDCLIIQFDPQECDWEREASSRNHRMAARRARISAWLSCTASPRSDSRTVGKHLEPVAREITLMLSLLDNTKDARMVN